MLYNTRGIVLNYIKYGDTSIITKIYTEMFGLQTYIVNGVRKSRSKNKMAFFQPLSLLEVVVYHHPKKDIQRISEVKFELHFQGIPFEIKKTSIAIFMAEVLNKTLKEEQEDLPLFQFVHQTIKTLDQQKQHIENYHLVFLIRLGRYLGIAPHAHESFLQEHQHPGHGEDEEVEKLFTGESPQAARISRKRRNEILDELLKFYGVYYSGLHHLKSIEILREVLGQ